MSRNLPIAVVFLIVVGLLLWRFNGAKREQRANLQTPAALSRKRPKEIAAYPSRTTNRIGDILTDAHDPEFANRIFPKFQEFVATLKQAAVSPFDAEIPVESCSKIRIIQTPNGIICPFLIGEEWTADYMRSDQFEGIAHFGPVGRDNPFRAIGRADTNNLRRLSEQAVIMPQQEGWKISERVADALAIDRSRYESPQMTDEALFEYQLGFQTVRYRAKGTDPLNKLNYTRTFTLKATSPSSAVLIRYSNLDAH